MPPTSQLQLSFVPYNCLCQRDLKDQMLKSRQEFAEVYPFLGREHLQLVERIAADCRQLQLVVRLMAQAVRTGPIDHSSQY